MSWRVATRRGLAEVLLDPVAAGGAVIEVALVLVAVVGLGVRVIVG